MELFAELSSIMRNYKLAAMKVITKKAIADDIDKIKENLSAIVIYCTEDMVNSRQFLIYIKDKAVEEDIQVFAVGNSTEIKAIEEIIPRGT